MGVRPGNALRAPRALGCTSSSVFIRIFWHPIGLLSMNLIVVLSSSFFIICRCILLWHRIYNPFMWIVLPLFSYISLYSFYLWVFALLFIAIRQGAMSQLRIGKKMRNNKKNNCSSSCYFVALNVWGWNSDRIWRVNRRQPRVADRELWDPRFMRQPILYSDLFVTCK